MTPLYTIRFFSAGEQWYISDEGQSPYAKDVKHFEEDEANSRCLTLRENGYRPIMELVSESLL